MGEMAAEEGREGPRGGAEEVGDLLGEVGELVGVEGGDVSEEHGQVAEVFGDDEIGGDACGGGEIEGGLVVEEVEGGVEVAVEEAEL